VLAQGCWLGGPGRWGGGHAALPEDGSGGGVTALWCWLGRAREVG
jgi:hypothetical protein